MSLRQFIDNPWFKGLARGLMILGAAGAGYAAAMLNHVNGRVDAVSVQIEEIKQNDRLRAAVDSNWKQDVTADLDILRKQAVSLTTDVATIKGILQEIRREAVAERFQPFTSALP